MEKSINITIKHSTSFKKINTILSDLNKIYNIKIQTIKDNNVFEIYYKEKIIYTFEDDFNQSILTSKNILNKISQYFSNHEIRKRPPNAKESDNIFLDEF